MLQCLPYDNITEVHNNCILFKRAIVVYNNSVLPFGIAVVDYVKTQVEQWFFFF